MSQKSRDGRRGGYGKPHGGHSHSSHSTPQNPSSSGRNNKHRNHDSGSQHGSRGGSTNGYHAHHSHRASGSPHNSVVHATVHSPAHIPIYTPAHSHAHHANAPAAGRQGSTDVVARGPYNGPGPRRSGSGNGYDNGKPKPAEVRRVGAETARISKRRPFGAVCRGDGRDSCLPRDKWNTPEGKPFSHMLAGIKKDDPALVEEREAIRKYLLATYPSLRQDTPNLAYLVERCINAPDKDLHPVIRTHAFSNLMQYGNLDHIYSEILHFCTGISQCRGGQGLMSDDVVMCDCDGHVPMCFMTSYTNLLRDYLELRESCEQAKGLLQKPAPATYSAPAVEVLVDDMEIE